MPTTKYTYNVAVCVTIPHAEDVRPASAEFVRGCLHRQKFLPGCIPLPGPIRVDGRDHSVVVEEVTRVGDVEPQRGVTQRKVDEARGTLRLEDLLALAGLDSSLHTDVMFLGENGYSTPPNEQISHKQDAGWEYSVPARLYFSSRAHHEDPSAEARKILENTPLASGSRLLGASYNRRLRLDLPVGCAGYDDNTGGSDV